MTYFVGNLGALRNFVKAHHKVKTLIKSGFQIDSFQLCGFSQMHIRKQKPKVFIV